MTIDPHALSALSSAYAKGMTSIRGRRVQRLIRREFAGADRVCIVQVAEGASAVWGWSGHGAGFCATDGTGKHATVFKWLHASTTAVETHFDLWKDSLPALSVRDVPRAALRRYPFVHLIAGDRSEHGSLEAARHALVMVGSDPLDRPAPCTSAP